MSSFGKGVHLERVVIVGSRDIGCVGSELHLRTTRQLKHTLWLLRLCDPSLAWRVLGGIKEVFAAICGECNTVSLVGIHSGIGVFEKVIDGWFDKFEGSARSDGNAHIRVREEQF